MRASRTMRARIAILRDAAKTPLLRMRTATPPAALIATDSASLLCSTISSTSSSRLICGHLAGEQPLLGQHDHAMQRGPDFQGLALAQESDGGSFQRLQQQAEGFHGRVVQLAAFGRTGHRSRREHQTVDAVAAQTEIQRGLREAR